MDGVQNDSDRQLCGGNGIANPILMMDETTSHIGSVGRQNALSSQASVNTPRDPMFQLLEVQMSAILDSSPCIGSSGTIQHGVPKAVAELMVEQMIQEFEAGCKTLTEEFIRANIQNRVEEWKHYAAEVIKLLLCQWTINLPCVTS